MIAYHNENTLITLDTIYRRLKPHGIYKIAGFEGKQLHHGSGELGGLFCRSIDIKVQYMCNMNSGYTTAISGRLP